MPCGFRDVARLLCKSTLLFPHCLPTHTNAVLLPAVQRGVLCTVCRGVNRVHVRWPQAPTVLKLPLDSPQPTTLHTNAPAPTTLPIYYVAMCHVGHMRPRRPSALSLRTVALCQHRWGQFWRGAQLLAVGAWQLGTTRFDYVKGWEGLGVSDEPWHIASSG